MRRLGFALAALCLFTLAAPRPADARKVKVKLATVAPKGTAFHRILEELAAEWASASGGKVALKIYPGGVPGDEVEVVRKIRLGTLNAGLITSNGLAEIDRAVNALQIPLAYRDTAELDFVRSRMEPAMEKAYADKGFMVLAWSEAGWVRFLSVKPIVEPADAHALKMFINAGNPEQVEVWRSGGFKPVPLPVTEITTALQTGLIEAVPTTDQAAVLMRWSDHAKHLTAAKWAPFVGALIHRTSAANPACRFRAGSSSAAYFGSLAAMLAGLGLLLLVMVSIGVVFPWLIVVKLIIIAVLAPLAIRWLKVNRPRSFDPGAIPASVLPSPS